MKDEAVSNNTVTIRVVNVKMTSFISMLKNQKDSTKTDYFK